MKKRIFVLLAFLLSLYIVPSILAPSSSHAAILAGPNVTREFSPSSEYEASDQSITSFSETLPDDEMFLPDNESYGEYSESFADVSDWSIYSAGNGISTDGDIGIVEVPNDNNYDYVLTNAISIATQGYYLECRTKYNTTAGVVSQIVLKSSDNYGGTTILQAEMTESTSWNTRRFFISSALTTESIAWITKSSGGNVKGEIDYLLISPADELGWQHDGSTNASITPTAGDIASSDGDIVTLDTDVTSGSFEFVIDTTATAAAISCTYYPFLSMNITSLSVGDGWRLWQYDGSAWVAVSNDEGFGWTSTTGMHRYNILSLDSYVYKFRFNVTATALLGIDFIKAYSIANFTYTGTGTSLDDVLYVDSGVLYCQVTSITSIILDHDPALSLAVTTADMWNVTTSSGIPQSNYYVGAWAGYSSDTSGTFTAGTLTDVRVKFTDSANIGAIIFLILLPEWHEVATAIIIFSVALDETALNWLIIFLGLFMIPASTLYLVKGGRDNLSMNKFFFFIVAFMLGWGLLLGGIYG